MFDALAWAAATARPGDTFDAREAARAAAFFPRFLRLTKGRQFAGQPFLLQPWQDGLVRALFGWRRPDGLRRFRQLYLEVARKNGKTELAAGLGLFLLFADNEPGAELYSVATDKDQAAIVFNTAARMRGASVELRDRSLAYKNALAVPKLGASWKPMSADSGNKDGLNPHGITYDEVHAFRSRDLYDVMHTALGARQQPMEIFTTTAGTDRTSLWAELREHAERVRDGQAEDPELLPAVFAAAPDDDIEAPNTWAKANPNLGITVMPEYLAKEAAKARALPRYLNAFKRLHLNIRTEQTVRWLPMEAWDAAPARRLGLRDQRCFAGLDLSSTTDVSALALVFPDDAGGYDVLTHFWRPRDTVEDAERRDRKPYREWARAGLITLTEGNVIDYERIRAEITGIVGLGQRAPNARPLVEDYDIIEVALDRWNATQMSTWLMADGISVVGYGQGFASMSAPSKLLESLVLSKRLRHGDNPVLRWMAENVSVATDPAENIKPVKDRATGRIDGIVATIMALGRAMQSAQADGPGIYIPA